MVALAVAAPAYATSVPCVVQTNFDDLTPGTKPTSLTFLPSTVTATIAYASTGNGGDDTPGGTGQVAATDTNPSWNYLEVEMLEQLTARRHGDGHHHVLAGGHQPDLPDPRHRQDLHGGTTW